MKVLESSSAGDKRFSALYVKVRILGVMYSIENHYQNSKHGQFCSKEGIGKSIHHVHIKDRMIDKNTLALTIRYYSTYI